MLIRSQDKRNLINFNNVSQIYETRSSVVVDFNNSLIEDGFETIGHYSTEEKALKVLDMIEQAYRSCVYTDCAYDYSAKVERPYIFAKNRVFQMPADEEVEV